MTIDEIKSISILQWMRSNNYGEGVRKGKNYFFCSPLRSERTPSFAVNTTKNLWCDFGNAYKNGGNIWSGEGTILHDEIVEELTTNTVEIGEGMTYSNEYAQTFSSNNFDDMTDWVENLYANGSMPRGYTCKGDLVYNKSGVATRASTVSGGVGKKSTIYLFKSAFTSKEQLYLTMGHEYLHAKYLFAGLSNSNAAHAAIRNWEYQQLKTWNLNYNKRLLLAKELSKFKDDAYETFIIISSRPF